MRFTPIAAATLIPATVAGIALSIMPFAAAVPAAAATRPHAHVAVHPHAPARHAPAAAPSSATQSATPAPQHTTGTQPATAAPQGPAGPVMSPAEVSFEKCVAWRESGDNPQASSAGMFGILPSTWAQLGYPGTAEQASVVQQVVAFDRLYHMYGTQPWTPSDGC